MVLHEFQKRDRSCDDKLPQPSTHAVSFSKTIITGKPFFSPQIWSLRNEFAKLYTTCCSTPTTLKCILSVICKHRFTTSLPVISYLHSVSLLAPFVWRAQSCCSAPGPSIQYSEKQSWPGYGDVCPRRCGLLNQKCGAPLMNTSETLGSLPTWSVSTLVQGEAAAEKENPIYPFCSPSLLDSIYSLQFHLGFTVTIRFADMTVSHSHFFGRLVFSCTSQLIQLNLLLRNHLTQCEAVVQISEVESAATHSYTESSIMQNQVFRMHSPTTQTLARAPRCHGQEGTEQLPLAVAWI